MCSGKASPRCYRTNTGLSSGQPTAQRRTLSKRTPLPFNVVIVIRGRVHLIAIDGEQNKVADQVEKGELPFDTFLNVR